MPLAGLFKKQDELYSPATTLGNILCHVPSQLGKEEFSWSINGGIKKCDCMAYILESTHLHRETNLVWERPDGASLRYLGTLKLGFEGL